MKTTKDFFERLQSDEEFAKEIGEKVKAKYDEGVTDYKELWIPLAAEYGYGLSGEELDEMYEKASGELSDEELGKVSGGATPIVACTIVSYISVLTLLESIDTLING